MTRVDELAFPFSSALYLGEGAGIAVIDRATPFEEGSSWARVSIAGPRIGVPFLYLERRAGGYLDGRLVVEDQVFAVSGNADSGPVTRSDLDPRLTSLGAFGEVEDADFARRADAESGDKLRAAERSIRENTFAVLGWLDGRPWRVVVGPTLPDGTTVLLCDGDGGRFRRLTTSEPRSTLERARTEPVQIPSTELERRRIRGGVRTRAVSVTLAPERT